MICPCCDGSLQQAAGTGMESATKYQDSVYFATADGDGLYVNLFSSSTLDWAEKGVSITQTTNFPVEQGTTLTVTGKATFDLHLRVPAWAQDGFEVTINDRVLTRKFTPGTYTTISRVWRTGDTVRISMPFRLRVERALDDPAKQTLFYGPINLVARDARTTYLPIGLYRNAGLSGDLAGTLTPVENAPLRFTLDGVEIAPFLEGTEDPTHVYFQRVEPRVVFGNVDSGVANPAKGDGTTLLDEIWAAAPFRTRYQLIDQVKLTKEEWEAAGLLSAADAKKVVNTARKASYLP